MTQHLHVDAVAIDPLAVIFPTHVYLILMEKIHPHEPVIAAMQEVAKSMSAADKRSALARAKMLGELRRSCAKSAPAVIISDFHSENCESPSRLELGF